MPALSPTSVALVVLAGGRGRRLGGVVKPLLATSTGEPIIARIARVHAGIVGAAYVVAPRDILERLAKRSPLMPIADPGLGPCEALSCASRHISEPWLFLVGGDQPRPALALLQRFLGLARAAAPAVDAIVAEDDARVQPFPALYRTASIERLSAQAAERALSLPGGLRGPGFSGFLDEATRIEVPMASLCAEEREAFMDVDTPEAMAHFALSSDDAWLDPPSVVGPESDG